ncbi:MAG: protein-glutamate O-methyltransferase CheR [Deltaproteobacteria bacterium]|nr:protein-glutamate O-methyltransferase CheR [Deltaproteobacteria bacterium]
MTDAEFTRFSRFIHDQCGITLPPAKKAMLASRLQKRLRALGLTSYAQYYDYVFRPPGNPDECTKMIDAVTTNRTEFFREPHHFEYLRSQALPSLLKHRRPGTGQTIRLWSAGCSSGEEPYSLAITMAAFISERPGLEFSILATDLSATMIAMGQRAVYGEEKIRSVPFQLRKNYVMRGVGSQKGYYRIVPELRRRVQFKRLNLMDPNLDTGSVMDIVFCRNVIIYFDRETQQRLFKKIFDRLASGGFLFIGHAETLDGINNNFVRVAPTIYRKPAERSAVTPHRL